MKKKDLFILGGISILSLILGIVISGKLINSSKETKQEVEVVKSISSDFNRPPEAYYNQDSINPTKLIQIGQGPNDKPFGSN
jgi:hypothetical protein